MSRISATFRIALAISSLSVTVVLLAAMAGLVPDRDGAIAAGRGSLCESLAVKCSLLVRHNDVSAIRYGLQAMVRRNPDLKSAAIRLVDGTMLAQAGPHPKVWVPAPEGKSTTAQMNVPIRSKGQLWGQLEASFEERRSSGPVALLFGPLGPLAAFIAAGSFFVNYFYLRTVLQQLDPAQAVPDRVRDALNTLVEGLLILDPGERVVLANEAFGRAFDTNPARLIGQQVSSLPWLPSGVKKESPVMPWTEALEAGTRLTGRLVEVQGSDGEQRTFLVNCAPILTSDEQSRGVLASFDDITPLEKKKSEMTRMLSMLQQSSDEISRQNRELERLATIDPLTGCLNRRAFFEQFSSEWNLHRQNGLPISCIMFDIDHFKSINDEHGHATGDDVLRKVAECVRATAREGDSICRYGGEEFCVLLRQTDLDTATELAEGFRQRIAALQFTSLEVTASFGVSGIEMLPANPEELLDQADQALYFAKRSGRNLVGRADQIDAAELVKESAAGKPTRTRKEAEEPRIPFHAVTALISALAYRDQETAEHSRRVADLAVALGSRMMNKSECYVLEIAALLHDIGKIGMPDSILLKPGPLTPEEWGIMRTHDRIGVEIIEASFRSPALSAIIRTHHAFFGGHSVDPRLPSGLDIPLGARILTICDSYDAIVSDRVYRRGQSAEAAFAELRRCAGTQFDPQLVERFISLMQSHTLAPAESTTGLSRENALAIGLQLERLATALDEQDLEGLRLLANRLQDAATSQGAERIALSAAFLEARLDSDADLLEVMGAAHDLLHLCRSTQRSYIDAAAVVPS